MKMPFVLEKIFPTLGPVGLIPPGKSEPRAVMTLTDAGKLETTLDLLQLRRLSQPHLDVIHCYSGGCVHGSAYGTRTRAPALRGPCPNRLDERATLLITRHLYR
jgi:hypothetical protein